MRKTTILLFILLMGIPTLTHAQAAKDAVRALKRLEAHCQTGISPLDFTRFLGDAKFEVNLYQESKEASKNIPLANLIKKIMSEYEDAHIIFTDKRPGPNRYLDRKEFSDNFESEKIYYEQLLIKYPDANKNIEDGGIFHVSKSDIGKENSKYGRVINTNSLLPIILRYASTDLKEAMKLLSNE